VCNVAALRTQPRNHPSHRLTTPYRRIGRRQRVSHRSVQDQARRRACGRVIGLRRRQDGRRRPICIGQVMQSRRPGARPRRRPRRQPPGIHRPPHTVGAGVNLCGRIADAATYFAAEEQAMATGQRGHRL
jgi:hypothetical protein